MNRASVLVAATAAALCLIIAGARAQAPTALSAQPGDVLRIDGTLTVLGKKWIGLVGVDLDVKPGTYPGTIVADEPGGTPHPVTLTVHAKAFPVRRLRVAPDFVNPPADEMSRIAADNKKTTEILARVTPKRWTGAFILPVDQKPTSSFGTRSFYNGQRRSPHAGADFLSGTGTPVRAANDGLVVLAEPLYFTGNTVMVDYGEGLFSLFAHLSEFRVHEGDTVKADTVVGLVGATGRVTGPHLHWAVRLQGARVDPLSLVAATR